MRPTKKIRGRTFSVLLGAAALIMSSATTAVAADDGTPDGTPVALTQQSEVSRDGTVEPQRYGDEYTLGGIVTLSKSTAMVGEPITVTWNLTGGIDPRVDGIIIGPGIADDQLIFWREPSQWATYIPINGDRTGSTTVTIPNSGDRLTITVQTYEPGAEHYIGWIDSDVLTVTNFDDVVSAEWGWVQDPTTGEGDYGYYAGGAIQKYWFLIDNQWYYANGQGFQRCGWVKDGASWYSMSGEHCAMQTGWVFSGGSWYYMAPSGAMQTGWVKTDGTWYYLQPSGAMATGWAKVGGSWYYLNPSGAMRTGWLLHRGSWYYMNPSGAMVTGKYLINGVMNRFNDDGVWLGTS